MLPLNAKGLIVRRKGKVLLGPIDLTLEGAGITVVMGPNGSGKTTLLRALHGIERLSDGTLDWAVPAAVAHQHQSFVFQAPVVLRRTVAGNLRYPLTLSRAPDQEARVADWAARAGLTAKLHLQASRLSGGERQKLALARALITAPKVLFLDEPCASLDGAATRAIEALLLDAASRGTRIILATHDMGQARRLASDALFMVQGQIHERGNDILNAPQTPELAAFLRGDIL
ncbi:ATP-binding cassette domain-containing protein [Yoonia sp. R2331]|uniref:ABC transporter ATP-binding protein n=1 Tax=Yoonia sp. R2331 TaxID=3237238 RepID=UPI0034E3CCDC